MASSKAGRDESRRDGISARIYDESTFTRSLSIFFSSKKRERERRIAAGSIVINYGGCLRELSGKVGVCQERNK